MKNRLRTRDIVLCAMFAALITAGAYLRIPIPYVPITFQFMFTNLAGLILGKRLGAVAVGVYILLGLIGLPVFTGGGGLGYVLQPTFGYILGFAGGAWLGGFVRERAAAPSFMRLFGAGLANMAVVYVCGMVYYFCISVFYLGMQVDILWILWYCFAVTVLGDIFTCLISAFIARRVISVFRA